MNCKLIINEVLTSLGGSKGLPHTVQGLGRSRDGPCHQGISARNCLRTCPVTVAVSLNRCESAHWGLSTEVGFFYLRIIG